MITFGNKRIMRYLKHFMKVIVYIYKFPKYIFYYINAKYAKNV